MLGEAVHKGAFKSFKIVVISFFFVNNNNTHCTPEKTQRISADSDFWSSALIYSWSLHMNIVSFIQGTIPSQSFVSIPSTSLPPITDITVTELELELQQHTVGGPASVQCFHSDRIN